MRGTEVRLSIDKDFIYIYIYIKFYYIMFLHSKWASDLLFLKLPFIISVLMAII